MNTQQSPQPPSSGPPPRGLLSFCMVSAGSAAFVLLMSIGIYHIVYKGVPTWKNQLGSETEIALKGLHYKDGKVIFDFYTPIRGFVNLRILSARGKHLLKAQIQADSGANSIAFDSSQIGAERDVMVNLMIGDRQITKSYALH